MRIKHFLAFSAFFACFTSAVLSVNVLPSREKLSPPVEPPKLAVVEDSPVQQRIRQFLEDDRETGHEYSKNLSDLRGTSDEVRAEATATFVLVVKMERADCTGLPEDFCAAWKAHLDAWNRKELVFEDAAMSRRKTLDHVLRLNPNLTSEINRTYNEMLRVAEKYGVHFSY